MFCESCDEQEARVKGQAVAFTNFHRCAGKRMTVSIAAEAMDTVMRWHLISAWIVWKRISYPDENTGKNGKAAGDQP